MPRGRVWGALTSRADHLRRIEQAQRLVASVGERPGRKPIPLTPDERRALDALRRLMLLGIWPGWGQRRQR